MNGIEVSQFRMEIIAPDGSNIGVFALTPGQAARMLMDLKCKFDYDKDIAIDLGKEDEVDEYTNMMNKCWDTMRNVYDNINIYETPHHQKSYENGMPYIDEEEED